MSGPLAGYRIIDLSTIILGPLATQILGDMGADVIKVESPAGDALRDVGPPPAERMGATFLSSNRNKRGVALDLKQAGGRDALLALTATADVFLHNMRPQAIERLGLGYASVREARADIVYCGTYGFRAHGPYGSKPAYDDMVQAASGLAWLQARDGAPRFATSVIADKVTAIAVAGAVAMALLYRERTGTGQKIEVPMFETMASFNLVEHAYGRVYDPPRAPAGYPRALAADRRPYATRDGYVGCLPYTDRQWQALFETAGRPDLAADPRYATMALRLANVDALYADLAAVLATRTTAEWLDALDEVNVPSMPVLSLEDLETDPHLEATGFWQTVEVEDVGALRLPGIPFEFSESPGAIRHPPPRLGEHTRELLSEVGYDGPAIDGLVENGAAVCDGR